MPTKKQSDEKQPEFSPVTDEDEALLDEIWLELQEDDDVEVED